MNERRLRERMKSILALSFAALMLAAASEKATALPFAPPPAGFTENHLTLASWNRCWRDSRGRLHCRRCSRDGWGGVRCGSAWR
jgi:uncharacterized lipoprotein YajG